MTEVLFTGPAPVSESSEQDCGIVAGEERINREEVLNKHTKKKPNKEKKKKKKQQHTQKRKNTNQKKQNTKNKTQTKQGGLHRRCRRGSMIHGPSGALSLQADGPTRSLRHAGKAGKSELPNRLLGKA